MNIVTRHLYELSDDFKGIGELIEAGEVDFDQVKDHLDAMEIEFDQKAIQVATVKKNIDLVATTLDSEIKRLTDRKNTLKNKSAWISEYLLQNMQKVGKTKIIDDLLTITSCKGREVLKIDCEDDINDKYVQVEVVETIDKKLLLSELKAERKSIEDDPEYDADNELIVGAHIERASNYIKIS